MERLDGREGTGLRERDGILDLALDLGIDRRAPIGRQHGADAPDLVAVEPGLEISARAIAGFVIFIGADMLAPAIGAALNESGAVATAQTGDDLGGEHAQFEDVTILDCVSWNAIGLDPLAQALRRPSPADRRVDGVVVVL